MLDNKKRRGLATGIYSATIVLLVGLVLVAGNLLTSRILARIDLTKDREFTVSKATREILRGLDDIVTVKVYFSKKLPPNLATLRRNIDDVLREYQAYSHGKVRVEYLDPSEKPGEEQKLRALGIPQVQLNVLEKDQLQVINGYMGIAILYADRHQSIPIVQDINTLEYDLTAGILQVLSSEKRTVGFLGGTNAPELSREFESLSQLLSKSYQVRPVDTQDGRNAIPPEINTLVVARPQAISERVQWQIDQFIMRGGRTIFLVDPMRLDEQMGLANPIPVVSGLDEMLAFYGTRPERALVQDKAPFIENAGFSQGYMRYSIAYPLWPKVSGKNLSTDNPVTSRLDALVLPWTAPLDVLVAETPGRGAKSDTTASRSSSQPDVRATILARSSPRASVQQGRFDLTPPNPFQQQMRPQEGEKSYPLAVALVGRFRSYFAGKPVPTAPGDSTGATASGATTIAESPETQVVVVGSSSFAFSNFLSMFPGNQEFILNTIDWMTLGDRLIAIRSRGATDRAMSLTSAGGKAAFKYVNTFGVALLVAVFGFVRFSFNRRRRRSAAAASQAAAGRS
jgi:ABC-2 type transport system permease protein